MEKKAEKQHEFILTPEEGGSEATVELIAEENATVGEPEAAPESPLTTPNDSAETVDNASKAEDVVLPNMEPKTVPSAASKENKLTKFGTHKKTVMICFAVGLFLLAGPIKYGYQWYCDAPRNIQKPTELLVPCIWSAWIGDADFAYALQSMTIMMNTSHSNPKKDMDSRAVASRDQTIKMLKRFWQEPGDSRKDLSRIVGSVALANTGDTSEAVKQFSPVIQDAQNPILRTFYGLLLAQNGDFKQALGEADEGLKLASANRKSIFPSEKFPNYWLKAQVYQAMGDANQALAIITSPACTQSVSSASSDREMLENQKASIFQQLGDSDKILSLFIGKRSMDSYYYHAIAYMMKNDLTNATRWADSMIPTDHDQRRYILLSKIYCKQGRLDKALELARKAEDLGHTLQTLEQLQYVLNKIGQYKESLAVSQDFAKNTTLNSPGAFRYLPQVHAGRAEAFFGVGDFPAALNEAQKALSLNPSCIKALTVARSASVKLNDPLHALGYENTLRSILPVPSER